VSFGNTYLGRYPEVPNSGFQGKLLEVRVWRFARSQSEIQANMTYFLTGRELGLSRCWTLNEGFGTAIGGKTTNRATGTVLGDATWEESEIPIKVNLNAQERLTRSTGLEDYGYWFKEMAKQQKTQADVPFRRGRIWALGFGRVGKFWFIGFSAKLLGISSANCLQTSLLSYIRSGQTHRRSQRLDNGTLTNNKNGEKLSWISKT
jgi:cyanobactin cluster PatC/TenC/TruC protein